MMGVMADNGLVFILPRMEGDSTTLGLLHLFWLGRVGFCHIVNGLFPGRRASVLTCVYLLTHLCATCAECLLESNQDCEVTTFFRGVLM